MSEKQYRDKIATIKKQQGTEEKAAPRRGPRQPSIAPARPGNSPRSPLGPVSRCPHASARNADSAERKAVAEDGKAATASTRLGRLARDLATAQTNLDREAKAFTRREENKRKAESRATDQADARRHQSEKAHAREVARLPSPIVRYVHERRTMPAPKPEQLRVLCLIANPEQSLRTDAEVRGVQDQVRRELHRDLITIDYRPAATSDDLIAGLNDLRPHVVHFSGHAGDATDIAPVLIVLNGCDTLDGAEVLLESTAVVVATASSISDLAAFVFAARFYAAIAAAQSIAAAMNQGSVSVDLAGLDEGWKLDVLARPDVDITQRVLVQATDVD